MPKAVCALALLTLLAWPVQAPAAGKGRDLHVFNETGATIAMVRNGSMLSERLLPPGAERYLSKYLVVGENELQFAAICHGDRMGSAKVIQVAGDQGQAKSLVLQSSRFGSGAILDTPGCGVDPQNQKHVDCLREAEMAIQQVKVNWEKRCGLQGPLWNEDIRAQYRWCVDTDPILVENARFQRSQKIAECQSQAKYDGNCNDYAAQAAKQSREALLLACQPEHGMWSTDPAVHEEFCRDSPGIKVEEQVILRTGALEECRQEMGEDPEAGQDRPDPEPKARLEDMPGFEWLF